METKKLRPADCTHQAIANKLETQGVSINDRSISIEPNSVVLKTSDATLRIPMTVFEKFAQWYLEEQNVEVSIPSTNTQTKNNWNPSEGGITTVSPTY